MLVASSVYGDTRSWDIYAFSAKVRVIIKATLRGDRKRYFDLIYPTNVRGNSDNGEHRQALNIF